MFELSTVGRCVGKLKALLAAKRSPVRWGSQMCLNVLFLFLHGIQRFMVWCRAGLRGTFLSGYTDFFYEPQTLENR